MFKRKRGGFAWIKAVASAIAICIASGSFAAIPQLATDVLKLTDNGANVAVSVPDGVFDSTTKLYIDGVVTNLVVNGVATNKLSEIPSGSIGTANVPVILGCTWDRNGTLSGRWCAAEWHGVAFFDDSDETMAKFVPAVIGDAGNEKTVFYEELSGRMIQKSGAEDNQEFGGQVAEETTSAVAASAPQANATTAYWIGKGDRGNVNDPANWAVTNTIGEAVSGAAPNSEMRMVVRGATDFNCPPGSALHFREIEFGDDIVLTADCDWRGLASTVEYIDAPKEAYIDTGFAPNQNTRVVMDVTVQSTRESYFGVSDEPGSNWWKTKVLSVSNDGDRGIYSGFGNSGGGQCFLQRFSSAESGGA